MNAANLRATCSKHSTDVDHIRPLWHSGLVDYLRSIWSGSGQRRFSSRTRSLHWRDGRPNRSLGPYGILVTLPSSGLGMAGDVIVRVRGHTSNTAQLTEWKVPYTFELIDRGSLRQVVTLTAHIRADIRKTVQFIGQELAEPTSAPPPLLGLPHGGSTNTALDDSAGDYRCFGSHTDTDNVTESWSGSGSISYGGDFANLSVLEVGDSSTLFLTLVDWHKKCDAKRDASPATVSVLHPGAVLPGPPSEPYTNGRVPMLLDRNGTIGTGTFSHTPAPGFGVGGTSTTANVKLSWPETQPITGAPDPQSAR